LLLLTFDLSIAPGCKPLPAHLGGVLHGYVEGAVKHHAPHLLPVLRPNGDNRAAHFVILPPPVNQTITCELRFGVMLFGAATQVWRQIAQSLLARQAQQINRREVRIRAAWLQQPGNPVQALVADGCPLEALPRLETPETLYRRLYAAQHPERIRRIHTLTFRSPLLLASRKAQRERLPATGVLHCPTLGAVLDSIARRMIELEPGLADTISLPPGWKTSASSRAIAALTAAADPAKQVEWEYASTPRNADNAANAHRKLRVPGIVGALSYPASDDKLEFALLYWGQWLGVGQKTTMGCGNYTLSSS